MLTLDTPVVKISRVGATTAKKLKRLGIETVRDLILYFPFRYDDYTKVTPVSALKPGEAANVVGTLELIQNKRSFRRRMYITEALVSDTSGSVKVIWFNQPFITKNLKVGDRVSIAGKVEEDFSGPYFPSPTYERLASGRAVHTQGLVPIYHATVGLTQKQLRFLLSQAVKAAAELTDWLPVAALRKWRLLPLSAAVAKIHFPRTAAEIEAARQRLAFNELILLQLQAQIVERNLKASRAPAIEFQEEKTKILVAGLPFKLTNDQRKAAWAILKDLSKPEPMSRLLEGDVGSGKTMVAALAMYNVALNRKQAVLLAPTEILARQHFNTVSKLLEGADIKVGLVTRSELARNKKPARLASRIEAGGQETRNKQNKKALKEGMLIDSDIIIGTHALIQEKIEFRDLALAIVDEQHRFGVEQRKALVEKAGSTLTPHLLSMTATPIPRSLALALYGNLSISLIKEMPAGRKKIITRVVSEERRSAAYKFIREQIQDGRQVFVICPLIDPSDRLGVKSVTEEYRRLDREVFPDLAIGMLHGKLKAADKEKVMADFLEGKIKILVSTSVVEVGVDVPNASVMMIEGAERFGLAQLHQFRGRVGRSEHQSYCFLFSESRSERTLERLAALEKYNDGLGLARLDLKLRGAGEIYGTAQSGFPDLKMATLFDFALSRQARETAAEMLGEDASLGKWPAIQKMIKEKISGTHLE